MKTIFITGASSGIGHALAVEWSKRDKPHLILSARNREALEKVAAECRSYGAECLVLEMDLSEPSSIEKAVQEIESRFPSIDIVIHNGGISQRSMVKETQMEVYRRLMEVNFFGAAYLTKLLLPGMLKRRSGHFVVISSVMGKLGTPFRSGYAASKHALHGYFDCLRGEVVKDGLRVTLVCPGFIKTGLTLSALKADGSRYNHLDDTTANGMDVSKFAKKMISAVESGKKEVFIGGIKEWFALFLKRFFPSILFRVVSRAKVY